MSVDDHARVEVLEGRHQLAREEEGRVGVEPPLSGTVRNESVLFLFITTTML